MTIYLVRHGLASAGVGDLDPGLAELGHQQAYATAVVLRPVRPARLVVSPLRRTRETANPIARALTLKQEIRDEVAEVFDPRMPAAERAAMIGPFMAGRWSDQSESLRAWRQRVVDTVLEMGELGAATSGDLVIVSHYIAIGVIIGEAIGDDRVVPAPIANCSITSLDVETGHFQLLAPGSTAHLKPALISGVHSATLGSGETAAVPGS
jgi:broad specificity phosphatase PhoE